MLLGARYFQNLAGVAPLMLHGFQVDLLKCRSAGEVLLFLKSSDFVQHDIHHAYDECIDSGSRKPSLVLRKWFDFTKSMEFRCFVDDGCLLAICQRYCGIHYPFLLEQKAKLGRLISDFYELRIRDIFNLASFTFDVYVDKKERVWLIDFAPFPCQRDCDSASPHPLLTWSALEKLRVTENFEDDDICSILCVESPDKVDNQRTKVLAMHKVPIEVVSGELNGANIAEYLEKLQMEQAAEYSSSDDEE